MASTPILLLVDGHNLAYRAFHAIRDLSTRDGRATNAVFGFVKTLQRLLGTWQPSHAAVVFDGGLPRERVDRWAAYKAQRAPMPDALALQLPLLHDYLRLCGVADVTREGCEADDVLAGLAAAAEGEGAAVHLGTTDKDLYQLVSARVDLVPLARSGARIDAAAVEEKTGVPPARILEWLALTGDAVDNIPGVPGVGPKRAAALLKRFPSIDALYASLEAVESARTRAALAAHREDVLRNLDLMRLRPEAAGGLDWHAWPANRPADPGLGAFFEELEFHSLAREASEPWLL